MPNISQHVLDELNSTIDLRKELEARGAEFQKAGAKWKACCPHPGHDDKNPSFEIQSTPKGDVGNCWSCPVDFKGNAVSLLFKLDGGSFPELVRDLGNKYGVPVPDTRKPLTPEQIKKNEFYDKLRSALNSASTVFSSNLAKSKSAQAYIKTRGITAQSVDTFKVGYAPDQWHSLKQALLGKGFPEQVLLKAGLLSEKKDTKKLYDFYRGRIMLPIRDERGAVVGFGGRAESDDVKPKYLNSRETPIYKKSAVVYGLHECLSQKKSRLDEIVVVDGYLDVIMAHQHGLTNHVATCGTALCKDHVKKLFRHTDYLVLAFDGDKAGHTAAWRATQELIPNLGQNQTFSVVFIPDGEDTASMLQSGESGKSRYLNVLENRHALTVYYFDRMFKGFSQKPPEGKASVSREIQRLIETIQDPDLKELFQVELKQRLHQSVNAVVGADAGKYLSRVSLPHRTILENASTRIRQVCAALSADPYLALTFPESVNYVIKSTNMNSLSPADSDLLAFAYKAAIAASKSGLRPHEHVQNEATYLMNFLEIKGQNFSPSDRARYIGALSTSVLKEISLDKTNNQHVSKTYHHDQTITN
jgi:DNA primase